MSRPPLRMRPASHTAVSFDTSTGRLKYGPPQNRIAAYRVRQHTNAAPGEVLRALNDLSQDLHLLTQANRSPPFGGTVSVLHDVPFCVGARVTLSHPFGESDVTWMLASVGNLVAGSPQLVFVSTDNHTITLVSLGTFTGTVILGVKGA